MFVELQFTAGVFCRVVRERIRHLDLCGLVAGAASQPFDLDGAPTVVERVQVGEGASVTREPEGSHPAWIFSANGFFTSHLVPHLQVRQPVLLDLVKAADLDANGPAASTPRQVQLTILVDLAARAVSPQAGRPGPVELTYTLAVEWGILTDLVPPATRATIGDVLAGLRLPATTVDLEVVRRLVDPSGASPFGAINAGITCDAGGERVALRVETRAENDLTPAFFTTDPAAVADHDAGRDWAFLLGASFVEHAARIQVTEGLRTATRFRVRSQPTARYDPGLPGVVVEVRGEAVDACHFFVDPIDLDVRVTVPITFSVPADDLLRTRIALNAEPADALEVFACAVTAALLWPIVGAVLVDEDTVDLGQYILGLLGGPLGVFIAAVVAIEGADVPGGPARADCREAGDAEHHCDQRVDLRRSGLGVALTLTTVVGSPLGPALAGSAPTQRTREGAVLGIDVTPFRWRVAGRCREGFGLESEADVFVSTQEPGHLCTVQQLDDPLEAFVVTRQGESVRVRCLFPEGYTGGGRYPCRLRLVTSHGIRHLTIPAPADITGEERGRLETERIGAIASCYVWERHHTPIEEIGWLIDPPDRAIRHLQVWQFAVDGLAAQEQIHVRTPEGRALLTARPGPGGVAHLTVMLDGEEAAERLVVELDGALGGDAPRHEVAVQQLLYVHRTSVPAPAALTAFSLDPGPDGPVLTVAGEDRRSTWRLTARGTAVVAEISSRGTAPSDTLRTGSGIVALASLPKAARRRLDELRGRSPSARVLAAPRIGGLRTALFAEDGDGGVVYEAGADGLREVQRFPGRPWFDGVARSGSHLARHEPARNAVDVYELRGQHLG